MDTAGRTLVLSNNQLTEIPLFVLPNLDTLYLADNNLTEESKRRIRETYKIFILNCEFCYKKQ